MFKVHLKAVSLSDVSGHECPIENCIPVQSLAVYKMIDTQKILKISDVKAVIDNTLCRYIFSIVFIALI